MRRRTWRDKFRDAFRGVSVGLRGQNSFLVHLVATLLVVGAGLFFQVSLLEWSLLLLCVVMVFVAELLNTSIEWLARALSDQYDERIGKALDIASAAVLLASFGSIVVGALIFLPHLLKAGIGRFW